MAFIEIRADLIRVAKALENIGDLLDELLHPTPPTFEKSGEEDIGSYVMEVNNEQVVDAYSPRRNY